MGRSSKNTNAMKSAVVVMGALAFGWLTIEMMFKPFLDRARDAMDKADPTRDPDDDDHENPNPTTSSADAPSL
ncbi:hypothetical protein Syun_020656 [Stephania yunnanensis]|uniref:Outer envelope membrane protein 7 n=1 Tax=Stephania yunnanensis TaxID=152371 RepID=A0AAP0NPW2_9MAGN